MSLLCGLMGAERSLELPLALLKLGQALQTRLLDLSAGIGELGQGGDRAMRLGVSISFFTIFQDFRSSDRVRKRPPKLSREASRRPS